MEGTLQELWLHPNSPKIPYPCQLGSQEATLGVSQRPNGMIGTPTKFTMGGNTRLYKQDPQCHFSRSLIRMKVDQMDIDGQLSGQALSFLARLGCLPPKQLPVQRGIPRWFPGGLMTDGPSSVTITKILWFVLLKHIETRNLDPCLKGWSQLEARAFCASSTIVFFPPH